MGAMTVAVIPEILRFGVFRSCRNPVPFVVVGIIKHAIRKQLIVLASTICGGLYELMRQMLLQCVYIHMDATNVKYLDACVTCWIGSPLGQSSGTLRPLARPLERRIVRAARESTAKGKRWTCRSDYRLTTSFSSKFTTSASELLVLILASKLIPPIFVMRNISPNFGETRSYCVKMKNSLLL